MANWKIYPLMVGYVVRRGAESRIPVFYLTDGEHKVLVDTGGVKADGVAMMPYYQGPGENVEDKLASIGVSVTDIDTVIVTHLHWDHMSNCHLFPNAKFYLHKREYEYALAPIPTDVWAFDKVKIVSTPWTLLEQDEEVLPGLKCIHVGGHTPGSMVVIADTEKGRAAVTSDFITTYEQWESEPKKAGALYTDIIEYYRGIHKLELACDYIIPGHNDEVLTHEVYPY